MRHWLAAISIVVALPMVAHGADVALSEVLFNPAGVDTGFEYVVVENRGGVDADLAGWQLYPDGAGYFTFPAFSLGAGKRAKIHLRKEGTADTENLYHNAASSNMGNTSGSVALFSSATRDENTIVDFVQWGRAGETWESTAEKAALWTKGEFIAINPNEEGLMLRRENDGKGASAWELTVAGSNNPDNQNTEAPSPTPTPEIGSPDGGGKVYSGPTIAPTIKAYAGKDMRGIAGGEIRFEGKALGWEDELLDGPNVRYVWNFGDGAKQDGKKISHIYRYPGTYTATLIVVSGEDSARDDIAVTIEKNPVIVSEIASGADGFIELSNPSGAAVDISGWILKISDAQQFVFPEGTAIAAHSFAVFAKDTIGFTLSGANPKLRFFYPNGVLAEEFSYSGIVPQGQAPARIGDTVLLAPPTPGTKNELASSKTTPTPVAENKKEISFAKVAEAAATPTPTATATVTAETLSMASEVGNMENVEPPPPKAEIFNANLFWLLGSVSAGLVAGIGILFLRKSRAKEDV